MLKNVSLKILGKISIAAILVSGSLVILTAVNILNSNTVVNENWRKYQNVSAERSTSLAITIKELGYGGLIHHFKNYAIRQDNKYLVRVRNSAGAALSSLNVYSDAATSEKERQAVQDIIDTVKLYSSNSELIRQMVEKGSTVQEIDASIKINDGKALKGLQTLMRVYSSRNDSGQASKMETLSRLRMALGYGGMIHQFKNYVLRQDSGRIAKIKAAAEKAKKALKTYRTLSINNTEQQALNAVEDVIDTYLKATVQAERMTSRGETTGGLNKQLKVSDSAAFQGMTILAKENTKYTIQRSLELNDNLENVQSMVWATLIGAVIGMLLLSGGELYRPV